jgi:hypothetical protein
MTETRVTETRQAVRHPIVVEVEVSDQLKIRPKIKSLRMRRYDNEPFQGRFYRGGKICTQREVRLGLSLVNAVILAHRGGIQVLGEVGKGTQFVILSVKSA